MSTFEDRERSFERKFALDQELRFKAEARRNKLLGEWAAGKLGLSGAAIEDYIKAITRTHVAKGNDEVFRKLMRDFENAGAAISAHELRRMMQDFLAAAVTDIERRA
jgi:hypothetical protein